MPAIWNFQLTDANGVNLCELTTASGKQLTYKRNTYAEATFTLSHEDEAASLLHSALRNTGVPTLKAYRKSEGSRTFVLRFRGYLAPFDEDAEEAATLSPVFRSPFARLVGEDAERGRFTNFGDTYVAQDAGAGIALPLLAIANADGFTGLAAGTVETTKLRDRTYQYANIGEEIGNLSAILDGFDFAERFVDEGTTLAYLDIMAQQGTVQSDAVFQYGEDTLRNVRSVSRTVEPPVNAVRVIGSDSLVAEATDADSIARYGKWWRQLSQTDIANAALLQARANDLLRPFPTRTISFVPEPTMAPSPWDDYWLGDTVSFYARRGALVEDLDVRVNSITVVVDDNGNEAPEIPDPSSRAADADTRDTASVDDSLATIQGGVTVEAVSAPSAP